MGEKTERNNSVFQGLEEAHTKLKKMVNAILNMMSFNVTGTENANSGFALARRTEKYARAG